MDVAIQHYNDSQSHRYFCRRYHHYKEYSTQGGQTPKTRVKFGKELQRLGYTIEKKAEGMIVYMAKGEAL